MESLFLAIAAVIFVYILVMRLLPGSLQTGYNVYTQKALDRLYRENSKNFDQEETEETVGKSSLLWNIALGVPFFRPSLHLLMKANAAQHLGRFLLFMAGIFFLGMYLTMRMKLELWGFVGSVVIAWWLPHAYIRSRINKRNMKLIDQFPDALDMIVRSVRSGFPLNAALKMIAENMEAPLATEFQQVVNEIAYGRSVQDAMERMAMRIDQSDINFFVVVLSVQQTSGGNLGEILNNLSTVIRSRKQLRLKIRAMTSEGRTTGYVLGSLPVLIFILLYFVSPGHLEPLFDTKTGHYVLGGAITLVATSALIVKRMIQIKV